MKNGKRAVGLLLLSALLLCLCACEKDRGRTIHYDGYTVHTEKTAPQKTAPPAERSAPDAPQKDYVLNMSTMKFHDPSCPCVKDIKERNRWNYHSTRESVLEMGYSPCGLCKP